MLPKRLSNIRAHILWLQDFARSYVKESYCFVWKGPGIITLLGRPTFVDESLEWWWSVCCHTLHTIFFILLRRSANLACHNLWLIWPKKILDIWGSLSRNIYLNNREVFPTNIYEVQTESKRKIPIYISKSGSLYSISGDFIYPFHLMFLLRSGKKIKTSRVNFAATVRV